jgi:diazepam-binding inhibitor (GABA receptor modulator, acyl-CoA-binding protein)
MEIKQLFDQAASDSKLLSSKPSNETLLELYSLFKQAMEGDVNIEPPSNPFDFVNKAKYQSWQLLKGKPKEDAMKDYIALVNKLKG